MQKKISQMVKAGVGAASALALSAQLVMVSAQSAVQITQVNTGTGYATDIGKVINFILQVVMVIALLLVFGYLVMGGVEWITSGGEKGKTESARNKITSAVIGLIVLAASYAILQLLLRFLGFGGTITDALGGIKPINQQ